QPNPDSSPALAAPCPEDAVTLGDTNALPCHENKLQRVSVTDAAFLARGLDYWKRRLASAPSLDLAPGRRAQATGTRPGSSRSRRLPHELASALKDLSRRHQTTLFTTTLALLKSLLYHYTQETDILVGT